MANEPNEVQPEESDLLPTERVALVAWWLACGEQMTARLVADRLGMSYSGAYKLLQRLSRVLPLRCEDSPEMQDGTWFAVS